MTAWRSSFRGAAFTQDAVVTAGSAAAQLGGATGPTWSPAGLLWSAGALGGVVGSSLLAAPLLPRLGALAVTIYACGMAGILLTLGMAVDANILINERIREEQKLGRPPLQALEHGFKRAYSTIFDSNATAFLAHDAARLITGETLYVDGGYHIID